MLQFFDTFCPGITKHLTSLKPVLMFSLMLQGHIEPNDWFQIVGIQRSYRVYSLVSFFIKLTFPELPALFIT